MFHGFSEDLLSFCAEIRFHNSKAFMDEHREEYYRKVRDPYYAFIGELAPVMLRIDEEMETRPSKCLSRINRDTRFSRDKSPYRDHHWIAFRRAAAGKDGTPFYWFEIRLEGVSWGLGIWGENATLMDGMRRKMAAHPDAFRDAVSVLRERHFEQGGRTWKRLPVPGGLSPELVPMYMARELYFSRQDVEPAWIFDPSIVQRVADDFTALAPVWRLLRGDDTHTEVL